MAPHSPRPRPAAARGAAQPTPSGALEAVLTSPGAARAMSVLIRLQRLDRARPRLLDAAQALVIAVFGIMALVMPKHEGGEHVSAHTAAVLSAFLLAGQAAPLIWRRAAPTAVTLVLLAANLPQWWIGYSSPASLGLMLGIYAVARHDRFERLRPVMFVVSAALAVPAFRIEAFQQQTWTALFLLWCAQTAAAALGIVARVHREKLAALAERAARLEVEREQRAQLATLAERARVSREMHDIVGHHLSVIIGLADSAGYAADPERGLDMLRLISETGRQALLELRRTLGAMRAHPVDVGTASALDEARGGSPELSPQPGLADLSTLLDRVRAAGPSVAYHTSGLAGSVPAGVQLAAYRIVQEATTNSLKHAGPGTGVRVEVAITDTTLTLEVTDTGRPLPAGPARLAAGAAEPGSAREPGLGLGGIAERATLTGGTAEAGPLPHGPGWSVRAVLPLAGDAHRR